MRLDKYLAETAQCTRSEAKALLAKGRVTVNGAVCKKGDTQLKEADAVAVDGKALAYRQFVYLMLNKPEGVVSASTDKRDTTVVIWWGMPIPAGAVPGRAAGQDQHRFRPADGRRRLCPRHPCA